MNISKTVLTLAIALSGSAHFASAQSLTAAQAESPRVLEQLQSALFAASPGCESPVQQIIQDLQQYFSQALVRQSCPSSLVPQQNLDQISNDLHQQLKSAEASSCAAAALNAYVAGSVFLDYHHNKPLLKKAIFELINDPQKIQYITADARTQAGSMAVNKLSNGFSPVKGWYDRQTATYWIDLSERPFDTGRTMEYLVRQVHEPDQNTQVNSASAERIFYVQPRAMPAVSQPATRADSGCP